MIQHLYRVLAATALAAARAAPANAQNGADGVLRVRSANPMEETLAKRHGITKPHEQFAKASSVVESIISTLKAR